MLNIQVRRLQSNAEKYEIVKDAILHKGSISAIYGGRIRLLCPHTLGLGKNGEFQALFYQYGGESNSRPIQADGSPENWRCLALDKLSGIHPVESKQWHTAPSHSRPQTCVKEIQVEVTLTANG